MGNSSPVTFMGGAGIQILSGQVNGQPANGSMNIQAMNNKVLDDNGDGGIIENSGSVTYTGVAGTRTEVHMAFLNHGSATFTTGEFLFTQFSADTDNFAVKMDNGSFSLGNSMFIVLTQGLEETGGTLSTTDGTTCEIMINGAANQKILVTGGKVALNLPNANNVGALTITGGDLDFNGGEYDAKIDGQNNQTCDKITVQGDVNITQGTGILRVTNINQNGIKAGLDWDILICSALTIDFGQKFLPAKTAGPDPNQINNGLYRITS